MRPALARAGRRLLLATAPLLLVLEIPGASELLRRPDPGFKLLHDRVMEVEAHSPAARGGVRVDDVLVRVEGQRVWSHADLLAALARHSTTDSLHVVLDRGGVRHRVALPLVGGPADGRAFDLLMSLSALCFLFLGFVTYLRRDDALGRTFFLACLLLAFPFLDLPSFTQTWVMRLMQGVREACQILMPAMLLCFVVLFPEGAVNGAGRRWRQRWILLPAAALAPLHAVSAVFAHLPEIRRLETGLLLTTTLLFVAYVLTAIVVFARKIAGLDHFEMRTKLRLALMGLVAGVAPLTLMTLVRQFVPAYSGPLDELAIVALPLVPASFSVALLRSGAIDVPYFVRQALIAIFLTLPILVVAWLLAGAAQRYLPQSWRGLLYLFVVVAIPLASVLVRAPARTIAGWIDRVVYPEQRRVRQSTYRLGQRLSDVLAPDALMDLLVRGAAEAMGTRSSAVYESVDGEWVQTVPSVAHPPRLPAHAAIVRQVVRTRDVITVERGRRNRRRTLDATSWVWLDENGVSTLAPLNVSGETIALLALGPREDGAPYSTVHLYHLSTLCRQAAAALQNARLHQEDLGRERMRTELDLAHKIQQQLLPQAPLRRDGLEIVGRTESCRAVGGDLFDYFDLSDGRVVVVVADAAGKGIPASLLTSGLRTAVRETLRPGLALEDAVAHVNRHVHGMTAQGNFIALFVAAIEARTGLLEYCVAGIEPPVWVRADVGRTEYLTQGGPVLGIDPRARYRSGTLRMEPGDSLLAYSDGVIDEEDADGREFGRDRLRAVALGCRERPAAEILQAVLDRLSTHRAADPVDDTTLVVVRRFRSARAGMDDAASPRTDR